MAKVFLDANYLFDVLKRNPTETVPQLQDQTVCISVLSVHIFCYVFKLPMPQRELQELFSTFNTVDLTDSISQKSFLGPTADFEDNVQLHSAVDAEADIFLTNDQGLLQMAYFGKMKILSKIH